MKQYKHLSAAQHGTSARRQRGFDKGRHLQAPADGELRLGNLEPTGRRLGITTQALGCLRCSQDQAHLPLQGTCRGDLSFEPKDYRKITAPEE